MLILPSSSFLQPAIKKLFTRNLHLTWRIIFLKILTTPSSFPLFSVRVIHKPFGFLPNDCTFTKLSVISYKLYVTFWDGMVLWYCFCFRPLHVFDHYTLLFQTITLSGSHSFITFIIFYNRIITTWGREGGSLNRTKKFNSRLQITTLEVNKI